MKCGPLLPPSARTPRSGGCCCWVLWAKVSQSSIGCNIHMNLSNYSLHATRSELLHGEHGGYMGGDTQDQLRLCTAYARDFGCESEMAAVEKMGCCRWQGWGWRSPRGSRRWASRTRRPRPQSHDSPVAFHCARCHERGDPGRDLSAFELRQA